MVLVHPPFTLSTADVFRDLRPGEWGRLENDLLDELLAVRAATVALFRHLPRAAWTRTGSANGVAVSVRALAWIAAGHELHHRALLEERYAIPMGLGAMPGPA